MIDPLIVLALRLFLAILFATAAISKLAHRETFAAVIENYRILPPAMVRPFAAALPVVEVLLALMLVTPVPLWIPATVAVTLLAAFTVAMAVNVLRGRRFIDCGCFRSDLRQELSWWMVGRNLVMICGALLLFLPRSARPITLPDALLAVLISLTLWIMSFVPAFAGLRPPPTYDENFRASQAKRRPMGET